MADDDKKDEKHDIHVTVSASGGIARRLMILLAVALCVALVRCIGPEDAPRVIQMLGKIYG